MILQYYYWWFRSAIPAEICDRIVELGLTTMLERKEKFGEKAITASTGGWREKPHDNSDAISAGDKSVTALKKSKADLSKVYVRDSNVVFLSNKELYDIVWPFIHEANKKAGWNFEWDYTEDFQFTKYGPGQFYGWHTDANEKPYELFDPKIHPVHKNPDGTDFVDQYGATVPEDHAYTINPNLNGKIRKLSVTISLNDPKDYVGGNLRFDLGPHRIDRYHTCKEIRPKGSVIVFPSHVHHQVTPVTKGTRYSLVCWNLGKPFR